MWRWWFLSNPLARFMGQTGCFGEEARKQADEVAEDQAIALIVIVILGLVGGVGYCLLHLVGIA